MSFARNLNKDVLGVAAVEFAMIAPVMILLICGFMEYAHVSSSRTRLEASTMRAARAVAATDCPTNRTEIMRTIIERAMEGVPSIDDGKVEIITKSYANSFGDVGEPEPFDDLNGNGAWDPGESFIDVNGNGEWDRDMGVVGSLGGAGQVISYTARFNVASLFNFIAMEFNGSNVYQIEASTVFRNEPVFRSTGCSG
ncbi:MAG: TadE/TadG family type IV pilus assembly protein [Erythrobacter sp.]